MSKEEREELDRQQEAVEETVAEIIQLSRRMSAAADSLLTQYREVRHA